MPRAPADCYRPFVCNECSRSYTRSHDLLRHQRKHKGEYIACPAEGCSYKTEQLTNLRGHFTRKHINAKAFKCGRCDRSYDDEAALKRHLNRKHKGDGNGAPLADVQVFIDSSSQGSSRPDGRLDTPSLTQGSSGSEDSRGSTAGPSTPTVDIQVTEEAPGSAEDWWFQKLFPDEGTFAPFPSGTERMLENESASTPSQYRDASSFSMAPWPGWDMLMLPHYSSQFFFNGSESGV